MPRREQWGDGSDWRAPPSHCPVCLHAFNAVGHPGHNNAPKAGDYSVCIECATVLVLTDQLTPMLADPIKLAAERRADPALDRSLALLIDAVRSIPQSMRDQERAKRRRN